MCQKAGWGCKRRINTWSGWVMLRGGRIDEAQGIFDRMSREGKTEFTKQESHTALALLALRRGDADAARTHAEAVTEKVFKASADTMRRWADVLSGRDGAADALDTFDLLGTLNSGFSGWKYQRGLYIRALLRGSPLTRTAPPVRPKDVVVRMGKRHLCTWESVASLRQTPIPEGKTVVLVRRGDETFEVTVDLAATRAAAAEKQASQGEPTS